MNADKIHLPAQVGLFGGTFNPIHQGHQQTALDVLDQFNLDHLYFIPSALPPHKAQGGLATARDRFEMVRLAIDGHPRLSVSDVEIQRLGPSYTIDTINYFKDKLPPRGHLYFLLGMDAFLEIHTWKCFRRLVEETAFIVMSRPQGESTAAPLENTVAAFAKDFISEAYEPNPKGNGLVHPQYQPIYLAHVTAVDISSSRLRRMIREGRDIAPWVSPAVTNYIHQRGLYS